MAADVSLTVRISGAPEVINQLKAMAGSTERLGEATQRAAGGARSELRGFGIAAAAAAYVAGTFGGEAGRLASALDVTALSLSRVRAGAAGGAGLIGMLGPLAAIVAGGILAGQQLDKLARELEKSDSA